MIIGVSMFLFVNTASIYPELLLVRVLFSVGGAGATTMVTAILPSLTKTNQQNSADKHSHDDDLTSSGQDDEDHAADPSPHGARTPEAARQAEMSTGSFRIAGFVGTAAGCGALVAVFGFLRLPPVFQEHHLTADMALKDTYYLVGIVAFFAAIVSFFGLRALVGTPTVLTNGLKNRSTPIWRMPFSAARAAVENNAIAVAYLGGFVARASSVGISLFIPLWINSFYIQSGRCRIDDPNDAKNQCRDAYRLSSAITGASQLTALICAPLFGLLSERFRQHRAPIMLAAAAGVASYIMLAFIPDPRIKEGSIGPLIFLVAALTGLSQVGAIVCSLGILGHAIALSDRSSQAQEPAGSGSSQPTESYDDENAVLLNREDLSAAENTNQDLQDAGFRRIKGSIAGMYSFAGGVGILLLTKVGGLLFDASPAAPFWLLAGFNGLLFLGAGISVLVSLASSHSQR